MADVTLSPTGLVQPEVGASADSWGDKLNDNMAILNTLLGGAVSATPWTPVVSLATPGTSSFAHSTQTGRATAIADLIILDLYTIFTPTIGTGSGVVRVSGFPDAIADLTLITGIVADLSGFAAWPASTTQAAMIAATSTALAIRSFGSGNNGATFSASQLTNGVAHTIRATVIYRRS